MPVSNKLKWMVDELLDTQSYRLMIAGSTGNGKTTFIESLIDTPIVFDNQSVFASFECCNELSIFEITATEKKAITDLSDWNEESHQGDIIIEVATSK